MHDFSIHDCLSYFFARLLRIHAVHRKFRFETTKRQENIYLNYLIKELSFIFLLLLSTTDEIFKIHCKIANSKAKRYGYSCALFRQNIPNHIRKWLGWFSWAKPLQTSKHDDLFIMLLLHIQPKHAHSYALYRKRRFNGARNLFAVIFASLSYSWSCIVWARHWKIGTNKTKIINVSLSLSPRWTRQLIYVK